MLAAASIFLAVSIAGISVYHEFFHQHKHDQGLAENIKTRKTNENLPAVDHDQKNKELIIRENDQISDLRSDDSKSTKAHRGSKYIRGSLE